MLGVLAALPPIAPTESPPRARGSLLIVGGGERTGAMMRRFVTLAGGKGKAVIAVVPMASEEAAETGRDLVVELDSLGARSYVVLIDKAEAETDSVARGLDSATGSGGWSSPWKATAGLTSSAEAWRWQ